MCAHLTASPNTFSLGPHIGSSSHRDLCSACMTRLWTTPRGRQGKKAGISYLAARISFTSTRNESTEMSKRGPAGQAVSVHVAPSPSAVSGLLPRLGRRPPFHSQPGAAGLHLGPVAWPCKRAVGIASLPSTLLGACISFADAQRESVEMSEQDFAGQAVSVNVAPSPSAVSGVPPQPRLRPPFHPQPGAAGLHLGPVAWPCKRAVGIASLPSTFLAACISFADAG